jgi:hypothetical protein
MSSRSVGSVRLALKAFILGLMCREIVSCGALNPSFKCPINERDGGHGANVMLSSTPKNQDPRCF